MQILRTDAANFRVKFEEILNRGKMDIENVEDIVKNIINEVRERKNKALFEHISKFDKWSPKEDSDLEISKDDMKKAYENLEEDLKCALQT
jgi:histidinol dehydrogenase